MSTQEHHDEYFIVSYPRNENLGECDAAGCANRALYRVWFEKARDIKENLHILCDDCLAKTVKISVE